MNDVVEKNEDIQENDIYIFVKIGETSYAFPAMGVLEIIKLVELEYPERMPSYIAGLLEYKGKIIHIVDLRGILKVDAKDYSIDNHIVVIQGKHSIYGIIADEITDIRKVDNVIISPPPYSVNSCFTKGILSDAGKNTTVINLSSLEEWMKMSDKTEAETSKKASALLPRDIPSKEILHERKMRLVEKTNNVPYKSIQNKNVYISFLVGKNTYCLEIAHVGGFYKFCDTKIIKIPCTPAFVAGLISVKGDYITIIDLKKYFENETSKITDKSIIIAIQSKDFNIGFMADEIFDTMNIQINEIHKNKPQKGDNRMETIEYVRDGNLYLILNVEEILNNEKLYVG